MKNRYNLILWQNKHVTSSRSCGGRIWNQETIVDWIFKYIISDCINKYLVSYCISFRIAYWIICLFDKIINNWIFDLITYMRASSIIIFFLKTSDCINDYIHSWLHTYNDYSFNDCIKRFNPSWAYSTTTDILINKI